jgi:hypothetical protein
MIDMAWLGARRGWALEATPCGQGLCAVASLGFSTLRAGWWISDPRNSWITSNGGQTWERQPVR